MERAVLCTRPEQLRDLDAPFDRLYFGHEFCQRRLPSAADVRRAAAFAAEREAGFTLVTPFVTNAGLKRVRELADAVCAGPHPAELVVNDWGVLRAVRAAHPGAPLILGRLLTKQKRGPRLLRIAERLPPAARDHFRRCNADTPRLTAFLREQGIVRIELDNLLQGMRRPGEALPASLHYPYGYISTTRLCLFMQGDRPGKNLRSLGSCSRECLKYDVTLRHPDMPVDLHLKGNAQFFRNDTLPENLAELKITRLVHAPRVPA